MSVVTLGRGLTADGLGLTADGLGLIADGPRQDVTRSASATTKAVARTGLRATFLAAPEDIEQPYRPPGGKASCSTRRGSILYIRGVMRYTRHGSVQPEEVPVARSPRFHFRSLNVFAIALLVVGMASIPSVGASSGAIAAPSLGPCGTWVAVGEEPADYEPEIGRASCRERV